MFKMHSLCLLRFNILYIFDAFKGGLTPENVSQAAHTAGVVGVDVSSGVEQKGIPGVKDVTAMQSFVANARLL